MNSAQSIPGALASLTERNPMVLDGVIVAVQSNGALQVDVGQGVIVAGSQVDRVFRAGERVRMLATDQATYEVVGLATLGGSPRAALLPVPPSLLTGFASQSLQEALTALMIKNNQTLKRAVIVAIQKDGTMQVNIASRNMTGALARAATNRTFRAGEAVYAMQYDSGSWLVTGLAH